MILLNRLETEEAEETLLCCPACGSSYFLSSKSAAGIVFQVTGVDKRTIVSIRKSKEKDEIIRRDAVYCGACGWCGSIDTLGEALT